MEVSNRGLVVVVYVLFGAALTGVAVVCWAVWRPQDQIATALRVDPVRLDTANSAPRHPDDGYHVRRQEAFAEAARRIQQLELLLERKTELLNQRTALLNKRAADYDALRTEADRYLMILIEQLDNPMPEKLEAGTQPPERSAERDGEVRNNLQAELGRLRDELDRSALMEEALESQLDQVRGELDSAQARVAEAELAQLLAGPANPGASVPTEALVRIGKEAVPILTAALRDERPDIRRWAAGVLEEMGVPGRPALPALRTAANDTDPTVRQAVRRAIAAINTAEP